MKTLLVYFIMTSNYHWEFLAIEHVGSQAYCEVLAKNVASIYRGQPGNMRIVCSDDQAIGI